MIYWIVQRAIFYRRVLSYFWPDRLSIVILLLLISTSTCIGLMHVWPIALLVDTVLSPNAAAENGMVARLLTTTSDSVPQQIFILAVAALLLKVSQEVVNVASSVLNHRIGNNGMLRIRCDLFRKLQSLHIAFHHTQTQGDTIYRLTNDATGGQGVLNIVLETTIAFCTLVVMFSILLQKNVTLTLIAMTVVPLLLLTNVWFGRVLRERTIDAKRQESRFTATARQSVASILLVQAFRREQTEMQQFRLLASSSLRAWFHFHRQFACYRLCVGTIMGLGAAMIFGVGGQLVYQSQYSGDTQLVGGQTTLSVGDLVVFLTYLAMLYDPLCKLTGAATAIQQATAGMSRVFEVLDQTPAVQSTQNAISLPVQPRAIVFERLGFRYDGRKPILKDVTLRIEPGEMIAFVGSSGGGKSTLLNLLPRFYDPTAGALRLDDFDARDVELKDLRSHVALVLQDSMILPTTIAENIAYGRSDASREEIREVAELAGAAEFIDQLPDGLETFIQEGGVNLSGGQRQRIAIARALLTRAPVLVLDEPSSALDPMHEQKLCSALRRIKGTRTIILVSHRMNTVVNCDRIYVLQNGQIVEQGTHHELLRRGTVYSQLNSCAGHKQVA